MVNFTPLFLAHGRRIKRTFEIGEQKISKLPVLGVRLILYLYSQQVRSVNNSIMFLNKFIIFCVIEY